jgi:hypothetical protein
LLYRISEYTFAGYREKEKTRSATYRPNKESIGTRGRGNERQPTINRREKGKSQMEKKDGRD